VVWGLTLFEAGGDDIIDVDQFTESKVKAVSAIYERFPVLCMSFARSIDFTDEMAGTTLVSEIDTGVADMRRFLKSLAFHLLVFRAALETGSYASAAAQGVAGHISACMTDLAVIGL